MDDLNDILTGLDNDININDKPLKLSLRKSKLNNTSDILSEGKIEINIDLSRKKKNFVLKNKTKIFDSVGNYKKLKNINLNKEKNNFFKSNNGIIKNINNSINGKNIIINLSNKKINFLNNGNFKKRLINNSKYNKFLIGKGFFKKIFIIFIGVIFFYFLNGIILQNYVNDGYNRLLNLSNGDLKNVDIGAEIKIIKKDFIISDILFKPFLLIPNKDVKNIFYIIKGGKSLSFFLNDSYGYYKSLNTSIIKNGINNINIIELLNNSKYIYLNFSNNLESTIFYYDKVGKLFNDDTKIKFDKARFILKNIYNYLTIINRNFNTLKNIFGANGEKKYLILFQNNDEIRPTGGFIGSLGLIKIKNGMLEGFENEDIYSYEWEINKNYTNKIKAPEGINKITENLGIRDANYKIGFIESSYQFKYFLDLINKDIDGIIYINQNIILDLLDITGDIYFDELGEKINSDHFSEIFSSLVEAKLFKIGTLGTPKMILFDFGKLLIDKLISEGKYSLYSKIVYDNILSRDIVLNSFNTEENSLLWKLGLDGSISYQNSIDYNYPVFMSIGGGKTDRYMIRNFSKKIIINPDCSIDSTLNIIQKHHFTQDDENYLNSIFTKFNIIDKNILYIQGKTDNKQFIQVVLPKNSIIENPSKYIIDENSNNKVIKFYTTTRRLETITNTIKYKILNPECREYDFNFFKQSGIKSYDLEINYNGIVTNNVGLKGDFIYKEKNN